MKTSAPGRALIETREGKRLVAYRDIKGILTIGVGHTGRMSPPAVTAGMTITEAQCDAMLASDLAPVENVINTAVKVTLSQNEFDALASLGFNIGTGGLKGSTVVKKLNIGDVAGAANAILMWSKPAVLAERRKEERAQFLQPDVAVAAARATQLAVKATAKKTQAKASQAAAAALAGTGAVVAVSGQGHHASTLLWIAGALLVAGAIGALVAALAHRSAATLAANAGHQDSVAALGTASTDLANALKS